MNLKIKLEKVQKEMSRIYNLRDILAVNKLKFDY